MLFASVFMSYLCRNMPDQPSNITLISSSTLSYTGWNAMSFIDMLNSNLVMSGCMRLQSAMLEDAK